MNKAKTKGTPTTAPSDFQNKCCYIRTERQLLNIPLRWAAYDFFHMPWATTLEVALAWEWEHGVPSATTNSLTSQHGRSDALTVSVSASTGASAWQSITVGCWGESAEQPEGWLPWGRPCCPGPVGLGCSASHLSGQQDQLDWPPASVWRLYCSPPGTSRSGLRNAGVSYWGRGFFATSPRQERPTHICWIGLWAHFFRPAQPLGNAQGLGSSTLSPPRTSLSRPSCPINRFF